MDKEIISAQENRKNILLKADPDMYYDIADRLLKYDISLIPIVINLEGTPLFKHRRILREYLTNLGYTIKINLNTLMIEL